MSSVGGGPVNNGFATAGFDGLVTPVDLLPIHTITVNEAVFELATRAIVATAMVTGAALLIRKAVKGI